VIALNYSNFFISPYEKNGNSRPPTKLPDSEKIV
jgi:hypothetical protein